MADIPEAPGDPPERSANDDALGDGLTEEEMGRPVSELALLDRTPESGFLGKVRRSIERRRLGSQVTGFAWNAPLIILLSFVEMLAGLIQISGSHGTEDTTSGRNQNQEGTD